ncbi:tRNA lysidine(34) synthetase TilS [Allopusillimonas ginsengisoli]|uniref:tRNA lysidine(34) synthetase TilS n=1 Tax=Allopusillimonas ginsengisoli TaxID=453575 RepID=UPI00101F38BF|nr:tRNA lysidine(34) synthetase TilS [Allopusillimonas ginsengisoli]TEA79628.1 tRNA lysidine(34) synthetase TilS [Allopusillimonas ginsengisoli]
MLAPSFWQQFGAPALLQAIGKALHALPQSPRRLAVALSGGADSAMLAVHAALLARQRGLELHCFHVHHGLQDHADAWQDHAHQLARLLQLPCHTRCVRIEASMRDGMESAARDARYEAFAALAAQAGLTHILLAHHRDDQAETVLLRLLRGAGPAGLAAMAPLSWRGDIGYIRPWLDIDRAQILRAAQDFSLLSGWAPVQDPTNADDRYTRAAVRERLAPQLNERWSGWQGILARHARQSAQTREVLDEVAQNDFLSLAPAANHSSFSLAAWRGLSAGRQALVLRYWLSQSGLRMPTDARLQDLMRQMRGLHALGHDRSMRVKHGRVWIVCVRGRVSIEAGNRHCETR